MDPKGCLIRNGRYPSDMAGYLCAQKGWRTYTDHVSRPLRHNMFMVVLKIDTSFVSDCDAELLKIPGTRYCTSIVKIVQHASLASIMNQICC